MFDLPVILRTIARRDMLTYRPYPDYRGPLLRHHGVPFRSYESRQRLLSLVLASILLDRAVRCCAARNIARNIDAMLYTSSTIDI